MGCRSGESRRSSLTPGRNASMARRKYGLFNFLFDVVLTILTAGFWLIWVFVREMRNR